MPAYEFSKKPPVSTPVEEVDATVETTAPDPSPAQPEPKKAELATPAPTKAELAMEGSPANTSTAGVTGEIGIRDTNIPRLNIVQATSKLFTENDFPIGSFVLNKEVVVRPPDEKRDKPGPPMLAYLVSIHKSYQQKLPLESKERPMLFQTTAEVQASGGTVEWSKEAVDSETFFQSRADVVLLIQAGPWISEEDRFTHFPYSLGDEFWALAMLTVTGSSYTSFAKAVFTTAQFGALKGGDLVKGRWRIAHEGRKNEKGAWFVPTAKLYGKEIDPLRLDFLSQFTNRSYRSDDVTEETEG